MTTRLTGAASGAMRNESPIKSVQRGTISMAASTSSATATITAVDTNKTFLTWLGTSIVHDGAARRATILVLTNSTTVTVSRTDPTSDSVTSWEAVEFN